MLKITEMTLTVQKFEKLSKFKFYKDNKAKKKSRRKLKTH